MTNPDTGCARRWQQLEDQRTALLAELATWPPATLTHRPSPGQWSAVEILDHLVRAEAGLVHALANGLQSPHPLGPEERPRVALLDQALRSDQSFLVPAEAPEILPDTQTTYSEVIERWTQARSILASTLATIQPTQTSSAVFRHPFAGWMTPIEVLDHMHAHIYHHLFQLARLKAKLDDPSWTHSPLLP